jgi:hypothetical protein
MLVDQRPGLSLLIHFSDAIQTSAAVLLLEKSVIDRTMITDSWSPLDGEETFHIPTRLESKEINVSDLDGDVSEPP